MLDFHEEIKNLRQENSELKEILRNQSLEMQEIRQTMQKIVKEQNRKNKCIGDDLFNFHEDLEQIKEIMNAQTENLQIFESQVEKITEKVNFHEENLCNLSEIVETTPSENGKMLKKIEKSIEELKKAHFGHEIHQNVKMLQIQDENQKLNDDVESLRIELDGQKERLSWIDEDVHKLEVTLMPIPMIPILEIISGKWRVTSSSNVDEFLEVSGTTLDSFYSDIKIDVVQGTVVWYEMMPRSATYQHKLGEWIGDGRMDVDENNHLKTSIRDETKRVFCVLDWFFDEQGILHRNDTLNGTIQCERVFERIDGSSSVAQASETSNQEQGSNVLERISQLFSGNWQDVKNPSGYTSLKIQGDKFIRHHAGVEHTRIFGVREKNDIVYMDGDTIVQAVFSGQNHITYRSIYSIENGQMVYTGLADGQRMENADRYVHRRVGEPI